MRQTVNNLFYVLLGKIKSLTFTILDKNVYSNYSFVETLKLSLISNIEKNHLIRFNRTIILLQTFLTDQNFQ